MIKIDHLPRPSERIDLSLRRESLERNNVFPDMLRPRIRSFLSLCRNNTPRVTPWGKWLDIGPRTFMLTGCLSQRKILDEIQAPFLAQMSDLDQQLQNVSLACRERARSAALSLIDFQAEMDAPIHSNNHRSDPLSSARSTVLSAFCEGVALFRTGNNLLRCVRERAHNTARKQYKGGSGAPKTRQAYKVVRKIKVHDIISRRTMNDYNHVANNPHRLLEPVTKDGRYSDGQWIFIDLPTLALLSSALLVKDASKNFDLDTVWTFWSMNACFAGLPVSSNAPSETIERVSPAKLKYDPVWAVLSAFWALGAADDFAVIMALDHPQKRKRGAYIYADLIGPYNDILLAQARGEEIEQDLPMKATKSEKPPVSTVMHQFFQERVKGKGVVVAEEDPFDDEEEYEGI